jgi:hypothetical protein
MADVHVAAQWDAAFEDHLFNDVLRRVAPHLPDTPPTGLREPDTAEEIAEAAEFIARLAALQMKIRVEGHCAAGVRHGFSSEAVTSGR